MGSFPLAVGIHAPRDGKKPEREEIPAKTLLGSLQRAQRAAEIAMLEKPPRPRLRPNLPHAGRQE